MKLPYFIYSRGLRWLDRNGSDETYIKWMFLRRLEYWPDLKHPKTFNEKMNWIKLNDKDPRFVEYADKYAVRQHIIKTLGEEYLIPLIAVYDSPEDIDFEVLPDRFVLKLNNGAGMNVICKDKKEIDVEKTKGQLRKWLKTDFSRGKREWYYHEMPPKILCETYMEDRSSDTLFDYKVFCIKGKVRFIQVDLDRFAEHRRNIYDTDWHLLDWGINFKQDRKRAVERPAELEKMIMFAEKLSEGFQQLRVDFYVINDRLYFGEMTFFSGGGFTKFYPKEKDLEMGALMDEMPYPIFHRNQQ